MIAGMDSVTQLVTLGRPRPAGNGRVHDLSPAVTGQLVKTYNTDTCIKNMYVNNSLKPFKQREGYLTTSQRMRDYKNVDA